MKVVVGQNTIVKKITVGTPLRVGSAANGSLTGLDDVNGSVNLANGTILQYDSNSGKFIHVSAADITGSGLNVNDAGGLGSLVYDSANSIIQYTGPSADSVQSLFNATYDSSALGSLSYSNGTINLNGPTAAQIRALFSAGNDLQYNQATGEFSVTIPPSGGAIGDGGQALSVNTSGDYGSLSYDGANAVLTHVGTNDSDIRGSISVGGDLSYDQSTGTITYNKRTDADIRSLFSGGGDLTYNSTTGNFSITTGAHYQDSDARQVFSVNFIGDTAFDSSPYGGASYNSATGVLTINGTTDSNIRNSISLQDSGGLGSLTYDPKEGKFVYKGPELADISSLLSVNEGPTSLGDLSLDSATGAIRFQLDEDSIRSLITLVSDNEGGTHLSYDHSTGVITYRGPSTLEVRDLISVDSTANTGDGSLTYHESSGVFTYIGPSPAEVRAHFEGGLGIDYNEATGTFRLDSTANIVTGSIVTGNLRVTDSATIEDATINQTLNVENINSLDPNGDINITAGDDIDITAPDKIKLNTPLLITSSKTLNIRDYDSDAASLNGSGIVIGGGSNQKSIFYQQSTEQFVIGANTGLDITGPLTGTTIDSLNKRIDELPDSAQMKGILSAGPGLSYDNVNGIYRITSSGVVAGTYGDATNVPRFAVDSLGQIDSIGLIPISTVNNFQFDSTSGNLKITTATDSYNVGFTLDPYSTVNLVEDPNATPNTGTMYYTDARVDSNLASSRSSPIVRTGDITGVTLNATGPTSAGDNAAIGYTSSGGLILTGQGSGYDVTIKNDADSDVLRVPTGSKEVQLTGFLSGPQEFIIDPAAVGDNTGTVKILGNLQVEGTQTIINSTTITLNDKNIVIADSAADSSALDGSGITFGGTNVVDNPSFQYSHADERFVFNRDIQANRFYGAFSGQITSIGNHTTADLAEDSFATVSSGTMYFTQARARSSINFVDAGGDGSFVYDSASGTMTYTGPSPVETRAHFQVNDTGGDGSLGYDSASGKFTYVGPSPAETRAHLNVLDAGGDGSFTYDSATGKFTYTGPSPAEARAHFQVNDTGGDGSLGYDSATGKITYTGPSEAEWYQHFVDNADSFGDMIWDSSYGTKGGLSLHQRHIIKHQEAFADSFINSQEYFLYYSGTLGGLRKVSADTLSARIGGAGGGGAGGGLLSYVNL